MQSAVELRARIAVERRQIDRLLEENSALKDELDKSEGALDQQLLSVAHDNPYLRAQCLVLTANLEQLSDLKEELEPSLAKKLIPLVEWKVRALRAEDYNPEEPPALDLSELERELEPSLAKKLIPLLECRRKALRADVIFGAV